MSDIDKWQQKKGNSLTDVLKNPMEGFGKLFHFLENKKNRLRKENIEELAAQEVYYTDWLVLVGRWVVIVFLALYGIILSFFSIDPSNPLNPSWKYFSLLILWGLINASYHKSGGPKSRNTALGQMGVDICLLLFFVHYTGGAQSFCFALFVLVSVEAALQLRGSLLPLLVAAVSTVLFGLLLAGEAAGFLAHLPVFTYESHSALLNFSLFLVSGLLNFASVAVVTHLSEENREYSERLQAKIHQDMPTGTFTRKVLFYQLEAEIERCSRSHQALSVILIGIDDMEEYNQKFGYKSGDQLLASVGEVIKKSIRKSLRQDVGSKDIACRYSGDIFGIILPEAKPAYEVDEMRKLKEQIHSRAVLMVAQRLQSKIAEIQGASGPLRISIGGANWPYHGRTADELIMEAFRALMKAKFQGKNRVEVATKGSSGEAPAP